MGITIHLIAEGRKDGVMLNPSFSAPTFIWWADPGDYTSQMFRISTSSFLYLKPLPYVFSNYFLAALSIVPTPIR